MWEIAVHLAVAGGVYDGVFLCCHFSHEMSWNGILDLIESFSEAFPTYFYKDCTRKTAVIFSYS